MSKTPFCRGVREQGSHAKVKARSNQVSHEGERREEEIELCPIASASWALKPLGEIC